MNPDEGGMTQAGGAGNSGGSGAAEGGAPTAATALPASSLSGLQPPRTAVTPAAPRPLTKIPLRETITLIAGIFLCDLIFWIGVRDQVLGYSGIGVFFIGMAVLLWAGTGERRFHRATAIVLAAIFILGLRMLWQGNGLAVLLGLMLMVGLTMTLAGLPPFIIEGIGFAFQMPPAGVVNLVNHLRSLRLGNARIERQIWIPVCIVGGFTAFFVLANPDINTFLGVYFSKIGDWLRTFSPTLDRLVFWTMTALAVAGLLRPQLIKGLMDKMGALEVRGQEPAPAGHHEYATARNTLFAVTVLFAAYLAYEIAHLVVREIPEGFYYSGYAHRGAMWLTVALAFSTLTLGALLRAPVMVTPGAGLLRKLTLVWTVENLILAGCVMHRLQIYVNYNGMSKMRVVGYCGVAAVAIGFVLAVFKALDRRTLTWLVRRDLWALFAVCFAFVVAPVDRWVAAYNTRMILAGNLSPAVQISTHRVSAEGLPALLPLLESDHEIIREGVRALLAHEAIVLAEKGQNWRQIQWAEEHALERLTAAGVARAGTPQSRAEAIARFDQFSRQWYD